MSMSPPLRLSDGRASIEIHPDRGGGIGRYDVRVSGGSVPVFQTRSRPGRTGPMALGCNILMPFSNRISGGGFHHAGQFHALSPTLPGAPLPIHGNALVSRWTVRRHTGDTATLELMSSGPGPFRYLGKVRYRLRNGALGVSLSLSNAGGGSLPFGMGLHPWFVRTPGMRVALTVAGYWTETESRLPDTFYPIGSMSSQTLAQGAALPDTWINRAFTGWNGHARIEWPESGLGIAMTATAPLTTVILYSPSAQADHVCLEPVSHSVDSHNDTRPGSAPPQVLAPGETMQAQIAFTPFEL